MAINRKLIRLFQTQGTAFIIICKSNSKKAQQYAMLVFLRREILYKAVKYKEADRYSRLLQLLAYNAENFFRFCAPYRHNGNV